jgi:hypothetical protein
VSFEAKNIAIYYLKLWPIIQGVARVRGYAVAIHGSMERDFDIVAIPWVKEADEPESVIEAIRIAVNGFIDPPSDGGEWPREKPHGRKAWSIKLGGGAYLDVSVMPRITGTDNI